MGKPSKNELMNDGSTRFQSYKRGELAKEILLMIATGVAIPAAFLMPNIPIALKPLLGPIMGKCGLKRSEPFVRSIGYLKKRGLVSFAERDGQQILTLSEEGKKRLLQFDVDNMVIKKPKKWDGY